MQERARGVASSRVCVGPFLAAHLRSEAGFVPAGHVAPGDYARCRASGFVAHHAVVDVEAAALEPVGVGDDADAYDDEVDVEHRAVGEADALHPGAALDAHDADPEAHVDAVVAVEVGDDRAHGRAEPRSEEHTSELQSLMRISYAVF